MISRVLLNDYLKLNFSFHRHLLKINASLHTSKWPQECNLHSRVAKALLRFCMSTIPGLQKKTSRFWRPCWRKATSQTKEAKEIFFLISTNMAAVTSRANELYSKLLQLTKTKTRKIQEEFFFFKITF